jgi:hypothetical protein
MPASVLSFGAKLIRTSQIEIPRPNNIEHTCTVENKTILSRTRPRQQTLELFLCPSTLLLSSFFLPTTQHNRKQETMASQNDGDAVSGVGDQTQYPNYDQGVGE